MSKKNNNIQEGQATKNLKNIIWGTIFLSLLVPLIYSLQAVFPFIAPRSFFFMFIVQAMFFVWLVLAIKNKRYRPKMSLVMGVFLAFLGIMTLSAIFGADFAHSFWSKYERMLGLLMHIHLFAFFLVLSSFLKGERDWMRVVSFVAPIASFVALISLSDLVGIISLPAFHQNGATLGNTSFLGSYLMVAVFFSLYGFFKSKEFMKIFYGFNFIVISAGIFFNIGGRAMRGGFIAGMILLLVLYLAFTERKKIIKYTARVLLGVGIIASILVGFLAFVEGSIVREKIEGLHGMSQRFIVWEMAMEGIRERPILGWGQENFHLVFARNFDPRLAMPEYGGEIWFDRAHNVVFDYLSTVGFTGTILFFGMFVAALFTLWKEYFKNEKFSIWAPAVFTALVVAHFIQNLTVFDMISSYMLMFLFLAFVASLAPEKEFSERSESSKSIAIPSFLAVIVFVITLNYFVLSPYGSNLDASIALRTHIKVPNIKYYNRGIEGHIGRNNMIISFSESIINNQEKNEFQKEGFEEERAVVIEKMRFFKRELNNLLKRPPQIFKEYWITGRMYNEYYNFYLLEEIIYGDSEEKEKFLKEAKEINTKAKDIFTRALEISPRNQIIYWELAQIEINMGNIYAFSGKSDLTNERFKEAFLLTEMAVGLEPRYLTAHIKMLRVTSELLQDTKLTQQKAQEALEINPLWESELESYL